tara:strand:+ start:1973 stop:3418 length:1446 start_codon:yes stop_codon:yes gene_type:complete
MRYQERTYIQTPHTCVRNKVINIVSMSSDLCEFNEPTYTMTGATGMTEVFSAATISDHNIHIIDSGTTFDLSFEFTGNVETFIDTDTSFKYNIYRYNTDTNVFTTPSVFSSGNIEWSTFSGTSAFTDTLLNDEFVIDGEYVVKGSYDFTSCTDYLSELGDTNDTTLPLVGDIYGIYNTTFDDYFALIRKAIKPVFSSTPTDPSSLGTLIVESTLFDGVDVLVSDEITTENTWVGNVIVALNGITLAEDEDFTTLNNDTIIFLSSINLSDVVTVAYVNDGTGNGLTSESFIVSAPIASGATDSEGSNKYYYNTDINKNEIYMLSEPVIFNDVIVTLNGVTLANVIDYSQSTTNPKRIILNGLIFDSDVITISYNSYAGIVGTIYTDNFDIYWTVTPAPTNVNGLFTALVASDESFSAGTVVFSATTPYVTNQSSYNANINLSGYTGTTAVYKVTNQKDFTLLTGGTISTITDSDIIPITLQL